jgi:hypothetical protein
LNEAILEIGKPDCQIGRNEAVELGQGAVQKEQTHNNEKGTAYQLGTVEMDLDLFFLVRAGKNPQSGSSNGDQEKADFMVDCEFLS